MPAIGSRHKSTIQYGDATHENSTMEIFNGPITALTIAGFLTEFGTLQTATDAITLGTRRKQTWVGDETIVTNDYPTDQTAQREMKLLVQYQDVTTEKQYTLTVPTIDPTVLNFVPGGGDAVLFAGAGASTEITDWVDAFEALAKAPDNDTHAVEVVGMRFVGRNT